MGVVEDLRAVAMNYGITSWQEKRKHLRIAADEIESLRRRLQDGSPVVEGTIQHMAMEIAALKKERDELKKDAERYRWLRDTQGDKTVRIMDRRYCNLIIDAALAKLGADKGEK